MHNVITLPADLTPPREVVREHYVLEVLAPQHNVIDYDAWTSSRDALPGIFGADNDWPPYEYSLEKNLADFG